MADLIDRAALLEKRVPKEKTSDLVCQMIPLQDVLDAPTIDAEPVKHGEWIGSADGYADGELVFDMWECSECGYDTDGADEKPSWNFCPSCGADMRERIENG